MPGTPPGDTRKERDLELDKPITEVVIDDELEAVASDAQPQEEPKPAEEPAPVELKQEPEPRKSEFDEPSNRAFAHFRNENKRLKQQAEDLQRKIDELSERFNGKVPLSQAEHDAYLEYLADTNPDAWHAETLRRSQERATADALALMEKRLAPQRQEESDQHDIVAVFQQTQAAIDHHINTTFPEINKQGSPENKAFVEEIMRRVGTGSPEERQQRFLEFVIGDPQQIIDIAEKVSLRCQVASLTSAQSEAGRLGRVNQQGASTSASANQSKHITLTPEEVAFAKRNGWTPEEFAAFNARSK